MENDRRIVHGQAESFLDRLNDVIGAAGQLDRAFDPGFVLCKSPALAGVFDLDQVHPARADYQEIKACAFVHADHVRPGVLQGFNDQRFICIASLFEHVDLPFKMDSLPDEIGCDGANRPAAVLGDLEFSLFLGLRRILGAVNEQDDICVLFNRA